MKRCPKCNQVFDEEWLSFCTNDGTSLVDTSALPQEPPPTMMSPPMPPSVSPSEQPTINLSTSGGSSQQPAPYRPPAPYTPPQPMQQGWQPPPPPAYANKPQQGLAMASMILGIVSIPGMFCCYFGVITAPISIVMGIVSLVQIKNEPTKHGGKPLAIIGIITSALSFVFLILLFALGFASAFVQGLNR